MRDARATQPQALPDEADRSVAPIADIRRHAADAAALLKALANEQRLIVLCTLLDGAKSVGEINARVPLSQSALSQHLAVLRERGLVTTRRQSQTIYYALASGATLEILGVLYRTYCAPDAQDARAPADAPQSLHAMPDARRSSSR